MLLRVLNAGLCKRDILVFFLLSSYIVNWSSPKKSALTESSSEIGLLTLARNKRTPHSIKALGPKPFAAQLDLYLLMGLNPSFIFIPSDLKIKKKKTQSYVEPMLPICPITPKYMHKNFLGYHALLRQVGTFIGTKYLGVLRARTQAVGRTLRLIVILITKKTSLTCITIINKESMVLTGIQERSQTTIK